MKLLTVFAHPGARSFCHALLERFDAGVREAGHTNEIVDLYAIGFDPILRERHPKLANRNDSGRHARPHALARESPG